MLGSPVSRLEKGWDWTRPRPEKTGKNKTGQDWRLEKTTQKPVFMDWDWKKTETEWDQDQKRPEKTRLNKTEDWKRLHKNQSLWLRPVWTSESVTLIYPSKMGSRSPKTVKIWLRNKLNCTMLTIKVDLAEYYCIKFNSQPYQMFLGSF